MHHRLGIVARLLCMVAALGGCSSSPQVTRIDLTGLTGVYIVAYTARANVRAAMETQLVADLAARSMVGHPSHADLPDLSGSTPEDVIEAAQRHHVAAVLVVNPVTPEGTERIVQDPARISPEHPDLQAFFAHARSQAGGPADPSRQAIAEANLFLLQDGKASLFWSGAAWTQAVDGQGGGLRDLSAQIARALERGQRQLRGA